MQLHKISHSHSNAEDLVVDKEAFGHDIYQFYLYKTSCSYWLGRIAHVHQSQT